MRTLAWLALCGTLLAGCGFVEDMKDMFAKAQMVSKAIKDKHGWDTHVGWNMNNEARSDHHPGREPAELAA